MAINNITEELAQLRANKALHDRIDGLDQEKGAFVLKALLAAGHVSEDTLRKAMDLADTITW